MPSQLLNERSNGTVILSSSTNGYHPISDYDGEATGNEDNEKHLLKHLL